MKNILITGANSYIGTSFEKWVGQWPEAYTVHTLDMQDDKWKAYDFSAYDTVFHVAGIAHVKETKKNEVLYYKVNRDLAYEVVKKAKEEKVKQLIFLSSMSVYGMDTGVITRETIPKPKSNYGKSKLEAENLIETLIDTSFKIAILRPPMVYGKGCKGNYQALSKIAKKSPLFPNIENQRSMIYIENLCEIIRLIIANEKKGLFFPQNKEYVNTTEMVKVIAEVHGKKIKLTKVFNPIIKGLGNFVSLIDKAFGSLVYEKEMSRYQTDYQKQNFKESIISTER